jgi:hypothetical protein
VGAASTLDCRLVWGATDADCGMVIVQCSEQYHSGLLGAASVLGMMAGAAHGGLGAMCVRGGGHAARSRVLRGRNTLTRLVLLCYQTYLHGGGVVGCVMRSQLVLKLSQHAMLSTEPESVAIYLVTK